MGCVKTIDYDKWPKQGSWLGRRVAVCFNFNTDRLVPGKIVRDDVQEPFTTIIALEDGRYVLAGECQFSK